MIARTPKAWLRVSIPYRYSCLRFRHRDDLEQITDAVAEIFGHLDAKEMLRIFARWLREAEIELGLRVRSVPTPGRKRKRTPEPKRNYPECRKPLGEYRACYRHPERQGVYIILGKYYCRACGVTLRRKLERESV